MTSTNNLQPPHHHYHHLVATISNKPNLAMPPPHYHHAWHAYVASYYCTREYWPHLLSGSDWTAVPTEPCPRPGQVDRGVETRSQNWNIMIWFLFCREIHSNIYLKLPINAGFLNWLQLDILYNDEYIKSPFLGHSVLYTAALLCWVMSLLSDNLFIQFDRR